MFINARCKLYGIKCFLLVYNYVVHYAIENFAVFMFFDVAVIKIVNFATVCTLALAVVNVIYLNVFYLVSLLNVNWCIVSCFVNRS